METGKGKAERDRKQGLNRTMQYGNPGIRYIISNMGSIGTEKIYTLSFESDTSYQIWAEFKSYYVVWKHQKYDLVVALWEGLNRTMQYGNVYTNFLFFIFVRFKSYYVVWKRTRKDNCSPSENSLNRTMQYGNVYTNFLFLVFVTV